ncbi:hypothetical protein BJV74DRAFT_615768 [Russula compacta]|nr:hypothetical protein BJV74DRAFT_615768 [Russula compacta]
MMPLMPTVALAFFSLLCSAFVILRILLSIIPHRTLGRRVYPLTFSRPSSHSLPPADKSYVWLALCDISAVAMFVWEAFDQWFDSSSGGASSTTAYGVGSVVRLWLALTFRQTCFLIISALILIHVRLRKSVSFGFAHWFLWMPLVLLASVSTIVVGLFADTLSRSFLVGYVVYTSTIAVLSTIMFGFLVGSLVMVKRSLANFNQVQESSKSPYETAGKPNVTLSTEDIDAIREGSSWITSTSSSRRGPSSPYPYSTTSTRATRSIATSAEQTTPPVLPLCHHPQGSRHRSTPPRTPSPRSGGDVDMRDFGLFRLRAQSLRAAALTLSSQGSWIPSSLGTRPTLSNSNSGRSCPTTSHRSNQPGRVPSGVSVMESAIASTPTWGLSPVSSRLVIADGSARRVVAAASHRHHHRPPHRYAQSALQAERATTSRSDVVTARSPPIEISALRIIAWLAGVWVPLVLSLPYFICLNDSSHSRNSEFTSTLLVISVAISSPILVLNLLLRHPVPIPYDLFDAPTPAPPLSILRYVPSIGSGVVPASADRYKRGSGTPRLVTADVAWPVKKGRDGGGAVVGKGYRTRFPRLLTPAPRLSILPSPIRVGGVSGDAKRSTNTGTSSQTHVAGAAAAAHAHVPIFLAPLAPMSESRFLARRHSSPLIRNHVTTMATDRHATRANNPTI